MKYDKYHWYEESVQSVTEDVELFMSLYKQMRGNDPLVLREDFCGTFKFACEWVKKSPKHLAECLDLDPEPLSYGLKHHYTKLTNEQKKRIKVQRRNVITVSQKKADLIVANNFSFYIFLDRKTLVNYFKACRGSLKKGGMAIFEMVGGPGFIEKNKERRTLKSNGKKHFQYIWDQKSFNPINREGHYAIHFRTNDDRLIKDAFTYHWRIWTLPEVRDALIEAGFKDTCVFWETEYRGKATGEFIKTESGDNDWTWIAYIGGVR